MTIHDDLATLREEINRGYKLESVQVALDRVEAHIAALEQERDEHASPILRIVTALDNAHAKTRAAEADSAAWERAAKAYATDVERLRKERDEARSEAAEQKDALDRAYQARDDWKQEAERHKEEVRRGCVVNGWREVLDKHHQTGDYTGLGIWAQDNVPQLLAALTDMRRALRDVLVEAEPTRHRITETHPESGHCVWCDARRVLAATEETA